MELFSYLTYSNYGNIRWIMVWQRSAYSVGLLFVIGNQFIMKFRT